MFVPYLCPLVSIIVEQSRCSTSQLVPLQVKNRLEGCQTADFWIMGFEILIGLRMEASTTNVVRKLVLLRCKSTQLAVQLHHEGKLYSTCLVVNQSLVLWLLAICVVLQASLTSFYVNGSPCWHAFGTLYVFLPKRLHQIPPRSLL